MTDVTSGAGAAGGVDNGDDVCPKCKRKKHDKKYRRSMSERKQALLADADNPSSGLSPSAVAFIKKNKGNKVPRGHEVSHEVPLYTKPKAERCTLDKAGNMKTQRKAEHRKRHRTCGDQFHAFPR